MSGEKSFSKICMRRIQNKTQTRPVMKSNASFGFDF